MNCKEIRDLLVSYYYDDVVEEERRRIDEHLGKCSSCRREFRSLKSMLDGIRAPEPPELSLSEREEAVRCIMRRVERSTLVRRWVGVAAGIAAAAAVVLLVVSLGRDGRYPGEGEKRNGVEVASCDDDMNMYISLLDLMEGVEELEADVTVTGEEGKKRQVLEEVKGSEDVEYLLKMLDEMDKDVLDMIGQGDGKGV